jgi:hypothetical protein
MQAIKVKYLAPTNTTGARLKAICEGGTLTESRDYAIDASQQALQLAFKLANEKLGWDVAEFAQGAFANDDYFTPTKFKKEG